MWVQIPGLAISEGDKKAPFLILAIERQSALQLNTENIARNVERNEIGALPVIRYPKDYKPVVCKNGRDLLKIIIFLLTRIEILVFNLLKLHTSSLGHGILFPNSELVQAIWSLSGELTWTCPKCGHPDYPRLDRRTLNSCLLPWLVRESKKTSISRPEGGSRLKLASRCF